MLADMRKASISHSALSVLQEKLAYCFGRFAAPGALFYSSDEWNHLLEEESRKALARGD
jgi:hypothetical protein